MAEGSWIRIGAVEAGLNATKVNALIKDAIGKQMHSITQAPDVRLKIGNAFLKAVDPLIPEKSGALKESGRATPDGRVYWTAIKPAWNDETGYDFNYAAYVYDRDCEIWAEGEHYAKPSKNKNAVPRWAEQLKLTPHYDVFLNAVRDIIIEAHKGGQI